KLQHDAHEVRLRRARAEVRHPEPGLAEAERGTEEPDLVQLLREARADDMSLPPGRRRVKELDEPRADGLGHEMLLRDAEASRVPALSDLAFDAHKQPPVH